MFVKFQPYKEDHMPKPNLHPCYCPWCHKDLGKDADLGNADRVFKCGECHNHFTSTVWPGPCPVCSAKAGRQQFICKLDPGDKVPGQPCEDCQDKQATMDKAVADGGIRFQCTDCGLDGVFASSTPFAQSVRADLKKPAPEDVHVQIKNCPRCVSEKETLAAAKALEEGSEVTAPTVNLDDLANAILDA